MAQITLNTEQRAQLQVSPCDMTHALASRVAEEWVSADRQAEVQRELERREWAEPGGTLSSACYLGKGRSSRDQTMSWPSTSPSCSVSLIVFTHRWTAPYSSQWKHKGEGTDGDGRPRRVRL